MRWVVLIVGLAPVAAFGAGAEPATRAVVERTTVQVGQSFLVTIAASGSKIGAVRFPELEGVVVSSSPMTRSTSTQMEFSGMTSRSVVTQQLGYAARVTRPGKVTIPPIEVDIDGQTLLTQPIVLTATERPSRGAPGTAPGSASPGVAPTPQSGPSQQPGAPTSLDEVAFVESTVDKVRVFQGEPVELSLRLWVADIPGLQVGSYRGYDFQPPSTEGFYATEVDPHKIQQERNGYTYEVVEYRQTLYPTATGDLRIGVWHWEGVAQYGFQRRPLSLDTDPISIQVDPLPERPANFSGAVGLFTVGAHLTRNEVMQGVPTQLVVRVEGRGNPDAIGPPHLPKLANAYVSDPEKKTQAIQTPQGPGVEKVFAYTITPLEPGPLEIPPVEFCYFDPEAQAYKTETTASFVVTVLKSVETGPRMVMSETPVDEKKAVDVLGEDIFPVVTDPGLLAPTRPSPVSVPAAVALPALAYAGFAAYMQRRRRFENDTAYARRYHAKTRSSQRLAQAGSTPEPADEIMKAIVGFVADTFDAPEQGLTSADIQGLLVSRQAPGDVVDNVGRILRACERARYGGTQLSGDELLALTEAARQAIENLASAVKARGARP